MTEPQQHPDSRQPDRGRLEVVATPIGNLADLTPRAREALARADLIAAEDTRRTGRLLEALGLSRPMRSLHEHNERTRVEELIARLNRGEIVALVSDAGTPLLSDPGYALVRAAAAAGIEVRAVPGASALTAALSISGLATDRFVFEGFLPARAAQRRARLALLAHEPRTLVLFEAPHRIRATLADLARAFGTGRPAVIARELTKRHESVHRGTLGELAATAQREPDVSRGEITLVIGGKGRPQRSVRLRGTGASEAPGEDPNPRRAPGAGQREARSGRSVDAQRTVDDGGPDQALLRQALTLLLVELPPARAAAIASRLAGVSRSEAYALALALRGAAQRNG